MTGRNPLLYLICTLSAFQVFVVLQMKWYSKDSYLSHIFHLQENFFRKIIDLTMVRDRQHGPVVELNRVRSSFVIYLHSLQSRFLKSFSALKRIMRKQFFFRKKLDKKYITIIFIFNSGKEASIYSRCRWRLFKICLCSTHFKDIRILLGKFLLKLD